MPSRAYARQTAGGRRHLRGHPALFSRTPTTFATGLMRRLRALRGLLFIEEAAPFGASDKRAYRTRFLSCGLQKEAIRLPKNPLTLAFT